MRADHVVLLYAARVSGYVFGYLVSKDPAGLLVEHMNSSKVEVVPITMGGVVSATKMLEEYLDGDAPPPKDFHGTWQ